MGTKSSAGRKRRWPCGRLHKAGRIAGVRSWQTIANSSEKSFVASSFAQEHSMCANSASHVRHIKRQKCAEGVSWERHMSTQNELYSITSAPIGAVVIV